MSNNRLAVRTRTYYFFYYLQPKSFVKIDFPTDLDEMKSENIFVFGKNSIDFFLVFWGILCYNMFLYAC